MNSLQTMFSCFWLYVRSNAIMFVVGTYFLLAAIANATVGIDWCVPCIFKTLFDVHCPGCGLTAAFISLLKLDFSQALKDNWLIFIVVPFGFYYVSQDYINHLRRLKV